MWDHPSESRPSFLTVFALYYIEQCKAQTPSLLNHGLRRDPGTLDALDVEVQKATEIRESLGKERTPIAAPQVGDKRLLVSAEVFRVEH